MQGLLEVLTTGRRDNEWDMKSISEKTKKKKKIQKKKKEKQ